jgi:hypothetical protein
MARKELTLCDACGIEIQPKPEFILVTGEVKLPIQVNVYRIDPTTNNPIEGTLDLCGHCVKYKIERDVKRESE